MGSMLDPNHVKDKYDKKFYLLLLCQMRDSNSTSRGIALPPNRNNWLPSTVRTSRRKSCNQRVDCLLCSMAILGYVIYGMVLWTSARCVVCSLVVARGWLSSSSIATPLRYIQIHITYQFYITLFVFMAIRTFLNVA